MRYVKMGEILQFLSFCQTIFLMQESNPRKRSRVDSMLSSGENEGIGEMVHDWFIRDSISEREKTDILKLCLALHEIKVENLLFISGVHNSSLMADQKLFLLMFKGQILLFFTHKTEVFKKKSWLNKQNLELRGPF